MNADQLNRARAEAWHQAGEPLLTADAATAWLRETGLCLHLPRPQQLPAAAPTLVEATLGEANPTPTPAQLRTATELLHRLLSAGDAVALNLLGTPGEQPDFLATPESLPFVFALRGDREWKRGPRGKSSPLQIEVWKLLGAGGPLTAAEIKDQLGRHLSEAAALRALVELWGHLRVEPVFSSPEEPAVWQLLERRRESEMNAGARLSQASALSGLVSLYLQSAVAASEHEVETFLSPLASRSKVREVVRGLVSARQLGSVHVGPNELFHLEGSLPEFPESEPVQGAVLATEGTGETARPQPKASAVGPSPERKPYGRRSAEGQAEPWKRSGEGERADRSAREGERTSPREGKRPARPAAPGGERKPFRAKDEGERRPFRPREEGRERKAFRPESGRERRPFRSNDEGGERKPFRTQEPRGERKPFRPRDEGERRPFRPREDAGGERRPFRPAPSGEGRPFRPAASGAGKPLRPKPSGRTEGFRPAGSGEGQRPFRPKPSGERTPFRPKPSGEGRPFRPGSGARDAGPGRERRPFRREGEEERGARPRREGEGGGDRRPFRPGTPKKFAGGTREGRSAGPKFSAREGGRAPFRPKAGGFAPRRPAGAEGEAPTSRTGKPSFGGPRRTGPSRGSAGAGPRASSGGFKAGPKAGSRTGPKTGSRTGSKTGPKTGGSFGRPRTGAGGAAPKRPGSGPRRPGNFAPRRPGGAGPKRPGGGPKGPRR